ncbi:Hypothetical predicted protein [Cloeon dipterum]|uniref:Uncharacterized protein n=1 Tax=Cloeon dipterum TaxID=197152 RepID=A0A8S1E1Y4_9INSE|nr:Hypothetical predicted protein [Cloeon dipterum]
MSRIGAEFSQNFNLDNLWSAFMRLEDRRLTFTDYRRHRRLGAEVDNALGPCTTTIKSSFAAALAPSDFLEGDDASAIDARPKVQTFHPMVSAGLDVCVDCLYREKRTKKLEKKCLRSAQ